MVSATLVPMTEPIVIAHAGASGYAPANSFGAYQRAHVEYPGCWMEFDTQFSAEGELMAIHDETLERTTNGTGFVSDYTADQLQEYDASKGYDDWGFEPIPRVRSLLEEGSREGWRLIAEVKNIPGQKQFDQTGERYAEALCELFDSTAFPLERLVVICFWAPTLDAIKKRNDKIALGYLSVPDLPNGMGFSAQANAEICRSNGYHVSAPRWSTQDLTAEHVQRCHDDGIQVHVWTPDEPDELAHVVTLGLDGITSNYPDRVIAALGR